MYVFMENNECYLLPPCPYQESQTPVLGLGLQLFRKFYQNYIVELLFCSEKFVWDSCFQNPTENPEQYLKKINTKSTRNENILICKQVPRL